MIFVRNRKEGVIPQNFVFGRRNPNETKFMRNPIYFFTKSDSAQNRIFLALRALEKSDFCGMTNFFVSTSHKDHEQALTCFCLKTMHFVVSKWQIRKSAFCGMTLFIEGGKDRNRPEKPITVGLHNLPDTWAKLGMPSWVYPVLRHVAGKTMFLFINSIQKERLAREGGHPMYS